MCLKRKMKKFEIEKNVSFIMNFIQNETFSNSKSTALETTSRMSKSISQPASLRNSLVRSESTTFRGGNSANAKFCVKIFALNFFELVKVPDIMIFIQSQNLQIQKLLCDEKNPYWIAIIRLKHAQNNFPLKSNLYLHMNTIEIV